MAILLLKSITTDLGKIGCQWSSAELNGAGVAGGAACPAAIAISCANSIRMPMNPPISGGAQVMSTMTFFSSV